MVDEVWGLPSNRLFCMRQKPDVHKKSKYLQLLYIQFKPDIIRKIPLNLVMFSS